MNFLIVLPTIAIYRAPFLALASCYLLLGMDYGTKHLERITDTSSSNQANR
jgi:hypothetical protein